MTATTNNEAAALKEVTERFLFGDLIKVALKACRNMQVGWSAMTEAQQQTVIDKATTDVESAVREAVNIVASKTRPTLYATVEQVTFKEGIKAVVTFSKTSADRHAIADATGQTVLLVLPDYEAVLSGDPPKADKDQPGLLDEETN